RKINVNQIHVFKKTHKFVLVLKAYCVIASRDLLEIRVTKTLTIVMPMHATDMGAVRTGLMGLTVNVSLVTMGHGVKMISAQHNLLELRVVPQTAVAQTPVKEGEYVCKEALARVHPDLVETAVKLTEVKIISPSVNDGSKIICYTQGDTISSCKTRIYLAVASGSNPNIDVETTSELKNSISVGPVTKSSVLPGVSTMYSTDVTINGTLNSTKLQHLCVHASVGTSTSSVCYELSFVLNPESDSTTLAFLQRNATVKFVQPTVKDRSRILCKAREKCHVLMYTSFASSRHSCSGPSTNSSGSFTGCDKDDKDNDEDDPDRSAKATDPCCENVVSSSADVTVYQAHPRGPSCVTETAFKFASAGEKDICFQSASAKTDFQQICYKVGVYDSTSDPCSSSPCLNNGHCFHVDHNNFKCICADNYTGDKCEKGPCQPADNRCHNGAYCQTNYGVATCICRAGYSGQTCNIDPSSLHESSAEFTDTAEPLVFPCVIRQTCSIALLLTGPSGHIPMVSPGYIDLSILLEEIKTVDRKPVQNSYQTDIKIKPLELGVKDMCIQTMNITGVNTDELCFKVNVIFDVISIYGFKDRPHFIEPSMPTNTEAECMAEGPCHVLYHVTPGIENENECVTFIPHPPDGFVNYHLFSSCDNCKPGNSSNGNCTVDVSIVNSNIGTVRHFCLSVGLKGSSVGGERRCFNIIVKDPSTVGKVGCQILSCANGGFCDSHDPSRPVCFCPKGFSGTNCEKAEVLSPMTNAQTQTFIGDLALPTKLKCVVNKSCSIPFQVVSKPGITPTVSLGYNDLCLVEAPSLKALGNSSTVFEGYTVATPTTAGNFKLCLQANLNSKTEDEMCVMIEVTRKAIAMTDQTKPYFLSPTITTDSTVLCVVNKACHIDMHVTAGDNFGFVGRCPALTETSRIPVQGVHIFYGIRQAAECITDVSYIPPAADGVHVLCLQVALPGKKGEERCYTINVVNDTQEEVISPCRGVTCEHGGKCLVDFGSTPPRAYCLCTSGFTGNDCKLDIDDCRPNPCQNGATCVDQVNNYTCTCNRGYIGRDCEIDTGDCVPNPCKNGATCVDEGNNYTCICYPGHIGRHCEVVLDPCISNPCLRGTCFHHAPKYHCVCPAGYTGKKCEISISECQSQPCLNGGVCVDNVGYFTCNCSNGFVGKLCETDVDECISQPCLNGGFCKDG
ncbi:fibropellin-1-like, partial [Mercenaria mercenaria]|uniref:fibropellin-1-like n=1 Tax=Mercenaria mercenaria TaxID=6596 RepID=UPI00234F1F5D